MTGVRFNFHLNTHENVFGNDNFSWGEGSKEKGASGEGEEGWMSYVFIKSSVKSLVDKLKFTNPTINMHSYFL